MGTSPNPDANLSAKPTEAETPTPVKPTPAVSEPVEKPVHDPRTIEVEHNDQDPNSPTYREPADES